MFNLPDVQEDILQHIRDSVNVDVFEIAIPDPDTVKRNAQGRIYPYVAVQFQMPQHARGESFAGVWSADYDLPINLQAIAPTAELSRELANRLYEAVLGYGIEFGSGFRPRFGGAVIPITSNDGTLQAYIHPMSFAVRVQLFKNP